MVNGILSITDPCGRYMGMQTLARRFLGIGDSAVDIDISFTGPKEKPVAIVLALSKPADRKRKNAPVTYMKADYFAHSADEPFRYLLIKACSMHGVDKMRRRESSTYFICFNNLSVHRVTKEEFYSETCSFGSWFMSFDQADKILGERLGTVADLTLDRCSASECDLHGLFRRMPCLRRVDLTDVDFTDAGCLRNIFEACADLRNVVLPETILSVRCASDAGSCDTFSFAEAPRSEWPDYLGLDSACVITLNKSVYEETAGTKPAPKENPAPRETEKPVEAKPAPREPEKPWFPKWDKWFLKAKPAPREPEKPAVAKITPREPEKPVEAKPAPASQAAPIASGGSITDAISPEKWREHEETARKNRREKTLGIVIGVGVGILIYLIAYRLLG